MKKVKPILGPSDKQKKSRAQSAAGEKKMKSFNEILAILLREVDPAQDIRALVEKAVVALEVGEPDVAIAEAVEARSLVLGRESERVPEKCLLASAWQALRAKKLPNSDWGHEWQVGHFALEALAALHGHSAYEGHGVRADQHFSAVQTAEKILGIEIE